VRVDGVPLSYNNGQVKRALANLKRTGQFEVVKVKDKIAAFKIFHGSHFPK
jgi:hypothetical protein